jgi:hypothetical protein
VLAGLLSSGNSLSQPLNRKPYNLWAEAQWFSPLPGRVETASFTGGNKVAFLFYPFPCHERNFKQVPTFSW